MAVQLASTILCVDAGYRHTGVAVWHLRAKQFCHTELIEPPSGGIYVLERHLLVVRTLSIRLRELCRRFRPLRIVAELPVGSSRSARSAQCMALATGIVTTVAVLEGLPLEAVSPSAIKKWAAPTAGRQAVSKAQVIHKVAKVFGTRGLPTNAKAEHVADAMACLAVSELWTQISPTQPST